jgi:hypothetical protein
VAFFNNIGWLHSRQLGLGPLTGEDLERAVARHPTTILAIEDCSLQWASTTAPVPHQRNVLLLRDPLNNLASRLEGSRNRPGQFRTDEPFLDVYAEYCAELLGRTQHLRDRTAITFDRFVGDRAYRDATAAALGVTNLDAVTEVSRYGDGSSFSSSPRPSSVEALMSRYKQHPLPSALIEGLLSRPVIGEVCATVFGYDLAELAGAG